MFEPGTGVNTLRICSVSQSSANQRAGRAGRTEPGKCYTLYSQSDFEGMPCHQELEIRKFHLGLAVMRILALGIKNVQDFDFVDAPSPKAIEMATRNLVQLGVVTQREDDDTYELTAQRLKLVKLGYEPRWGKMILSCFDQCLSKEGVVLAAVTANCSSIFCRVGCKGDKLKSDRRKVKFYHPNSDLFTLLSVYREWVTVPREKNNWCWDNSINAKSMKRCEETVLEIVACLKNELNMIVASYWSWHPRVHAEHDEVLKNIIISSLAENVAMYSDVECKLERNDIGSYIVKIPATATKVVVETRRSLEQLMKGKIVDHVDITPTIVQLPFSREGSNIMNMIQKETGTCILFDKHNLHVRIFGSSDNVVNMAQQRFIDSLLALHESKQLEVHLRGRILPPDLMKRVVQTFGPDLSALKEKVTGAEFSLNTKRHCICINGTKNLKQKVEEIICEIAQRNFPTQTTGDEADCPVCLCDLEDPYRLEAYVHAFCRLCLLEQCKSAIKSREGSPLCCMHQGCGEPILLADLKSLLSSEKLEELFRASLGAFVAANGGSYRFCPSPDCPSVYRVADSNMVGSPPFVCGACYAETCMRCHLEHHPYSCETYKEFKGDPDSSLMEWSKGKDNVKKRPVCSFTIEKVDGCNHIECRCGKHVCWACSRFFDSSDNCYDHLRSVHHSITWENRES